MGILTLDMQITQSLAQYKDWWIVRDLLIPTEDNHSMHIDFLAVSPYCVFVGEIKTFRGTIVGNGMHKYWKQMVNGEEIDYFSPLMQNIYHIGRLQKFLKNMPFQLHFHSIVYMQGIDSSAITLHGPYPPDCSVVTSVDALLRIAQVISEKRQMILTPDETKFLYDFICKNQLRGAEERERHAQQSAEYKLNARKALMQQICPECLSPLRCVATPTANYWVCSRYPDCQYNHKI
ncbi:MAG: NERD domain-containing protein [Oscillospiraceae bacterium]|nr:NERD domain-containing protein [Oscillospiraceae bacterium]